MAALPWIAGPWIAGMDRAAGFHARFPRHARSIAACRRRRHRGRRLAVLAAAVALPGFANPQTLHSIGIFNASEEAGPVRAMAFERAGESFPGSAFYYLAETPYLPALRNQPGQGDPLAPRAHWDNEDSVPQAGPAARPLVAIGTPVDASRALQCLTMAIYYEAASESDAGQRAVAQVVMNRVAHPTFPDTVCGVVFQGSERRTGCQFTFTCDGSLARQPSRFGWARARLVAEAALAGAVYAPVGLATHYHTVQIHPYWADSLSHAGTIGAHRFYRWKGVAGQPGAFRAAYAGGEPQPGRHRFAGPDDPALAQQVAAADAAYPQTQGTAKFSGDRGAAASAPSGAIQTPDGAAGHADNRLPGSGSIRPEYARSGEWIALPR